MKWFAYCVRKLETSVCNSLAEARPIIQLRNRSVSIIHHSVTVTSISETNCGQQQQLYWACPQSTSFCSNNKSTSLWQFWYQTTQRANYATKKEWNDVPVTSCMEQKPAIAQLFKQYPQFHVTQTFVTTGLLGPRANAEMVSAFPSCLYMLLM
jgi:hypothetical protein